MGWTTNNGWWSIQQAARNWHGTGAAGFGDLVRGWEARYEGLDEVHHTEEFCYVDAIEDGFYTLSGGLSADPRRIAWHTTM